MSEGDNRRFIRKFEEACADDVAIVGGKNASLGEMIQHLAEQEVSVPGGFATTVDAYREFMTVNALTERIEGLLADLRNGTRTLEETGREARELIIQAPLLAEIESAIRGAYRDLCKLYGGTEIDVAVRSSATAEDLVDASFAGQQETFLNIRGEEALLDACRRCFASLFTDRAICYRAEKGFDRTDIALSVGVQKMVRSDRGCAGVMFTIDPESGFPGAIVINGSWGLGELVVQGAVDPDEFIVFKTLLHDAALTPVLDRTRGSKTSKMIYADSGNHPVQTVETSDEERNRLVLNDDEILQLARWGTIIEKHYGRPMDIEWAKDGITGELFIVQARPETVQSQRNPGAIRQYTLKENGKKILGGVAIGDGIAAGKVCVVRNPRDRDQFVDGSILVTEMTDPDWVPLMKRARAIVTDRGGRTCHAAIISRELGVPAIVGTGTATGILKTGEEITVCCAEGDQGNIYEGILDYDETVVSFDNLPETRTRLMLNIASPAAAFRWWRLPASGIGLARMEFIINDVIKIHPMALLRFDELRDEEARRQIEELTAGYEQKGEYFVDKLANGIARIAASQYPHEVIVRMSDFKTNEYADLIGGRQFEPSEHNPMLGWRGAARYYSESYRDGFALECRAVQRVREKIGLDNVVVMIPFCRTLKEADRVLEVMAEYGLKRGEHGLQVYVMCEIPSNIILADKFAERFDGFSIGSNDLTQLVLGVDRDSGELADIFDERDEAVKRSIRSLLESARRTGTKVGICGQAPSDYPDFAEFLVENGIDSISLNPDSIVTVKHRLAEYEAKLAQRPGRADVKVVLNGNTGALKPQSNGKKNGHAVAADSGNQGGI